jgi:hypothetical protein
MLVFLLLLIVASNGLHAQTMNIATYNYVTASRLITKLIQPMGKTGRGVVRPLPNNTFSLNLIFSERRKVYRIN